MTSNLTGDCVQAKGEVKNFKKVRKKVRNKESKKKRKKIFFLIPPMVKS